MMFIEINRSNGWIDLVYIIGDVMVNKCHVDLECHHQSPGDALGSWLWVMPWAADSGAPHLDLGHQDLPLRWLTWFAAGSKPRWNWHRIGVRLSPLPFLKLKNQQGTSIETLWDEHLLGVRISIWTTNSPKKMAARCQDATCTFLQTQTCHRWSLPTISPRGPIKANHQKVKDEPRLEVVPATHGSAQMGTI